MNLDQFWLECERIARTGGDELGPDSRFSAQVLVLEQAASRLLGETREAQRTGRGARTLQGLDLPGLLAPGL